MSETPEYENKPFNNKRAASEHVEAPSNKRNAGEDDQVAVKILIPAAAVGAIIGKGGESMRQLKNDNNCKVQMSKTTDTYPGTSERVCLLKGRINNIMGAITNIQEKIHEKCEAQSANDSFDHKGVLRGNEIKIVMPNTSAGMVIGKSGANIKDIRDNYNCQIQVFPKAGTQEAKNSTERVVTIAHDDHSQLLEAALRVLEKVAADPHHMSEINKEESGIASSGGKAPYSQQQQNASFNGNQSFNSATAAPYAAPAANGGYGYQNASYLPQQLPKYNPLNGLGNNELLSFLDNLQNTLRTSGFNEQGVSEVMAAMQVLAKYNIMGLGLGIGVAAFASMRNNQEQQGVAWR